MMPQQVEKRQKQAGLNNIVPSLPMLDLMRPILEQVSQPVRRSLARSLPPSVPRMEKGDGRRSRRRDQIRPLCDTTSPLWLAERAVQSGQQTPWLATALASHRPVRPRPPRSPPNPNVRSVAVVGVAQCDVFFMDKYENVHGKGSATQLTRLQSFITRYRPTPKEAALLAHVDGVHIDGSVVLGMAWTVHPSYVR